jgi:hypothetical protein
LKYPENHKNNQPPEQKTMRSVMFQGLRAVAMLAFLLTITAADVTGASLTTQYYTLDLPPDWTVVTAPKTTNDAVHSLIGQKNHKCSASINVLFKVNPGTAEKLAAETAKRLDGTRPVMRNGQLEFTFKKMGDNGYCIIREDKQAKLLLLVIVSGSTGQADFIYSMRSEYPALVPQRSSKPR